MAAVSPEMNFDIGLVNTIVARSSLSWIDGLNGVLEYVGYDIDDLARHSTFEETTFLLWNRRLPPAGAPLGRASIRQSGQRPFCTSPVGALPRKLQLEFAL